MERRNIEKSKSDKLLFILNFSPIKTKKINIKDIYSPIKSHKLGHLVDYNFDEKLKKLFDSKKFTIGDQFDQEGSEKFLSEKDECLKLMDLDYTVLYSTKKKSPKDKRKNGNKSKNKKQKLNHDLKNIPEIKNINKNDESFFSTESVKQTVKEFISKSSEKERFENKRHLKVRSKFA